MGRFWLGEAFKQGMMQAKPVLLEPTMLVEVLTASEYLGDCMGDLSRRRGKIISQESSGKMNTIKALVPLANMFGYIGDLRALSSGRASFTMEFNQYEIVPENIQQRLIA